MPRAPKIKMPLILYRQLATGPQVAREGIEELEFKPFNPVIKRTEIMYRPFGRQSVSVSPRACPTLFSISARVIRRKNRSGAGR